MLGTTLRRNPRELFVAEVEAFPRSRPEEGATGRAPGDFAFAVGQPIVLRGRIDAAAMTHVHFDVIVLVQSGALTEVPAIGDEAT